MLAKLCHCPRAHQRPSFRPGLERLEGRDTPSTTVLDVVPNPATVGQAVTLTATVTESDFDVLQPGMGAPTVGTVTFFDGAALLMTVTVTPKAGTTPKGVGQPTPAALGVGAYAFTASYSGENFLGIDFTSASTSSAVSETITPVPTPTPPVPTDVTPRVSVVVRRGLP